MLGSQLAGDANGAEDESVCYTTEGVYNESKEAYSSLAQLAGFTSMQAILEIFAQKLIGNLMHSAEKQT